MSSDNKIMNIGAVSGVFAGFAIKAGIGGNESSPSVFFYNTFCDATHRVQTPFDCGNYLIIIGILALFLSIAAISQITKTENRTMGITLYSISFFVGLLIVILFL